MNDVAKVRRLFTALYEARIGFWPAKGDDREVEQGLWWQVVDLIPEEKLPELFDALGFIQQSSNKKPLVPAIWRAWRKVEGQTKRTTAQHAHCAVCGGEGRYNLPCWVGTDKNGIGWDFSGEHNVLSSYIFPCQCSAGDQWRDNYHCPHELLCDAFDRQRAILTACGITEETNRQMTLKEYLEQAATSTAISVQGYKLELIRKSLLAEARRDGEDAKFFERTPIRRTLALLTAGSGLVEAAQVQADAEVERLEHVPETDFGNIAEVERVE